MIIECVGCGWVRAQPEDQEVKHLARPLTFAFGHFLYHALGHLFHFDPVNHH